MKCLLLLAVTFLSTNAFAIYSLTEEFCDARGVIREAGDDFFDFSDRVRTHGEVYMDYS